jgi:uncharacterized protein (TIGR02217 family)
VTGEFFHEVSLPAALALAASGGPERRVEIIPLASGGEVRNAVWQGSRRRWDIGTALSRLEHLELVTHFFEARGGPLCGFRFRDPFDHASASPGAALSMLDQALGEGDGETSRFPLVKAYGSYRRRIFKPVSASVRAAVNGVEQPVTVNSLGEITFADAPPAGAAVSAGFKFDTPVRFDTDRLDISREAFGAGRIIRIPLIELVN